VQVQRLLVLREKGEEVVTNPARNATTPSVLCEQERAQLAEILDLLWEDSQPSVYEGQLSYAITAARR
jgi:hypothetical protein